MSFDWNLYLALAKQLGIATADESSKRSAVSRAYYSAFHAASLSLKNHSVPINPSDARTPHLRIWSVYTASKQRECRRIGNSGLRLKSARVEADYEAIKKFGDLRVQKCIQDAETIVTDVAHHIPEGFKSSVNTLSKILTNLRQRMGI
jgi:uncharacterized protein (UPF0332 family)